MNDKRIIQSIKENDEQTIGILMTKYSRLLWKVASGILYQVGSESDVEEVVADVFIHLWQKPDLFDEKRSNLKNYLCLLCKSKSLDKFRILSKSAAESIDSVVILDYFDLEAHLIQKEQIQTVYMAIDSLSLDEQNVVVRRLLFDQKPKEISKATGLSIRQVENIIYRSKIKIRDFITNEGESYGR